MIRLDKLELKANLVILETTGYAIILDMNWLAENNVIIDCQGRKLILPGSIKHSLKNLIKCDVGQVKVMNCMPILYEEEYMGLNNK